MWIFWFTNEWANFYLSQWCPWSKNVWHGKLRSVGKYWNLGRIMNESLFGSPLFASALFGVAMFFFFRWVFVERYSAEEAKNYAILIAFVCAVITWGAFSWGTKTLTGIIKPLPQKRRSESLSKAIARLPMFCKSMLMRYEQKANLGFGVTLQTRPDSPS